MAHLTYQQAQIILETKPTLKHFCDLIIELFFVTDNFAIQTSSGNYSPARVDPYDKESDLLKITPASIMQHLNGAVSLGAYTTSKTGTTKMMAFDFDEPRIQDETISVEDGLTGLQPHMITLNDRLASLGVFTLFEFSGFKGYHLYCLYDSPVPADEVRLIGKTVTEGIPCHIEVFPKQNTTAHLGKGLGNLIKLPFALHRKSGKRSCLVGGDFQPLPHQGKALMNAPLNDRFTLAKIYSKLQTPKNEVVNVRIPNESPQLKPVDGLAVFFDLNSIKMEPGTRNEMTFIFVCRCKDKGYSKEQAMAAGERWLEKNRKNFNSPMETALRELCHDLDQVYDSKKRVSV